MTNIKDYNDQLVNSLIRIDLIDYFKEVHSKYYNDVDISFMDYFLSICELEDQFVIDHDKLKEYNVITTNETSAKIKRCLEQYDLKENLDYRSSNVGRPVPQGGISIKINYKLTPFAFKICLIRAKNSKVYAKYYLLLEIIFKYYNDYQNDYKNKLLSMKDDKIDKLISNVNNLQLQNKDQSKEIKELIEQNKFIINQNEEMKNQLDDIEDQNNDLLDDIDNLEDKIEDIKEVVTTTILPDRNPRPEAKTIQHHFIVLKNNDKPNRFVIMRAQSVYIDKNLKKYKETHTKVIDKTYNANPIDLFNRFKIKAASINVKEETRINKLTDISESKRDRLLERHKNNPIIRIKYSDIKINSKKYNEIQLINVFNECDFEKNNVKIP